MPLYIRKSVSVGPFRFNLSKSGLGVSAGIKGFRVGSGPKGNYVHVGRGGLYYRQSLKPPKPRTKSLQPVPVPAESVPPSTPNVSNEWEEGTDVLEMAPANAEQILSEINEKLSVISLWPFIAVGSIAMSLLAYNQLGIVAMAVILLCGSILSYLAVARDEVRKAVVILYDLETDAENTFERFSHEFEKIASCQKVWNIINTNSTSDWKRHAGAATLVSRQDAKLGFGNPSIIKTNVSPPCIEGGLQNLYFYPDLVLVIQGSKAGAISYASLKLSWGSTVFVEDEAVPSDGHIVGHTWRYVNKDGSPDRRFNSNYRIPQLRYPTMTLQSRSGLEKVLHLSSANNQLEFSEALESLKISSAKSDKVSETL